MNKFTKLLSIFVIAGAVGCGVGAVAGCKNTPSHTHNSVKHEKVDATCTVDGVEEYYTCSTAGCEGKYYADEACTQEVELADLTIAKRGEHTYKYTDNGDGTHNKECEHGDLTETTEEHTDANTDKECDDCGAKIYTITLVPEVPATCTATGVGAHYVSDNPALKDKLYSDAEGKNEVTADSLVIPMKDHADANTDKTCDDCGAKIYTITLVQEVPATCTATGVKAHYVSDNPELAGKYYSDAKGTTEVTQESLVIPMIDHVDENADKQCDVCDTRIYTISLVPEKPATCYAEGMKEHYVSDNPELAGKYYSDAKGTTEVTADSLKIEKSSHTLGNFTPNEDATHNGKCSVTECGETVKNIPCVDEDKDGKCDVCGGDMTFLEKVLTPGTYINRETKTEFILADDGFSVQYTEDQYTDQQTGIIESGEAPTWQIAIEKGEKVEYVNVGFTRNGFKVGENYIVEAPATVASTIAAFKGVYRGELVLASGTSVTKITEISIYDDGSMRLIITPGVKGADGVITYSDSYVYPVDYPAQDLWHNAFTQLINGSNITFMAVEGSSTGVSKIEVSNGENKGEFTYEAEPAAKVSVLPTNDFTIYSNDTAKLLCNLSYGNKLYTLYYEAANLVEAPVTVLSGNDADGYLISTYSYTDAGTVNLNYLLKMVKEQGVITSIDLCNINGTKLETLTLTEQTFPALKEDGTANTGAVVDEFYPYYAYYKVEKTGWYTFESVNGANIYDKVTVSDTEHTVGYTPTKIPAGGSKVLKLEAGSYVAVSVWDEGIEFTTTYSATEPEPNYTAITGSSYTIDNFKSANEYYLKGTTATAGKYYVSVVDGGGFTDRGSFFEIGGVKYGYHYDSLVTWTFSEYQAGKVYSADLEAGAEVKIKVGCENGYLSLGTVTVYFETEEQYNNRTGGGSVTPTPDPDPVVPTEVFTADQQGAYVYENTVEGHTDTYTFTLGANTVTFEDSMGPLELTYKSQEGDVYTFVDEYDNSWTFSFDTDGNLVASDGVETYTAVKGGTSSGGETPAFAFTADQQGYYSYTYNTTETIAIVVGLEDITYSDTKTTAGNGFVYTFDSLADGAYTFKSGFGSVTFSFVDGNLYVANDSLSSQDPYTAVKGVAPFAGFATEQQGDYTYTYDTGRGEAIITITLGEKTVNYVHSVSYPTGVELTVTEADGVYTCSAMNGDVVFSFNPDGSLNVTSDMLSQETYTATKKEVESGSSGIIIGENTITNCDSNTFYSENTFTATEAGEYTFDFSGVYPGTYGSRIGETSIKPNNDGKFSTTMTLEAGQTVEISVEHYDVTVAVHLTITKA